MGCAAEVERKGAAWGVGMMSAKGIRNARNSIQRAEDQLSVPATRPGTSAGARPALLCAVAAELATVVGYTSARVGTAQASARLLKD